MAEQIVEQVNTIFQCFDTYSRQDNNPYWSTKDSLVDVLDEYFEQYDIETLNPLRQHGLIESNGQFGKTTLCTFSDLLVAIRYKQSDKSTKNALKLVFTWSAGSQFTPKAIWITVPQNGLWYRANVPVPLCFKVFGKMHVYKLTETLELQELSKSEINNIEVTGLLLSGDDKSALYGYAV